jgi:hypothetical protein
MLLELAQLLGGLEEVKTWESAEHYVTFSGSIPLLRALKKRVAHTEVKTPGAIAAKTILVKNLDFRFSGLSRCRFNY